MPYSARPRSALGQGRGHEGQRDRDQPERVRRGPTDQPSREERERAHEVERDEAKRAPPIGVREHPAVHDDHDKEPDGKGDAVRAECMGHGERAHEEPGHPSDQQQACRGRDRWHLVRQPHVAAVHPEEDDEDQDDLGNRGDRQVVFEHRRQLGHGEHEHEVEEELERGDAGAVVVAGWRHRRRHPPYSACHAASRSASSSTARRCRAGSSSNGSSVTRPSRTATCRQRRRRPGRSGRSAASSC